MFGSGLSQMEGEVKDACQSRQPLLVQENWGPLVANNGKPQLPQLYGYCLGRFLCMVAL